MIDSINKLDFVGKNVIDKSNINFTNDQAKAVDGLIIFIDEPFNPTRYCVGLTGFAGTGKTFITNYIITHCKYSFSVIKCTSPTHKACRVFSQSINNRTVETIQSTFGFRLDLNLEDFDPARPQFNPKSKAKLDNVRLLLIDEASMLPYKLVRYICDTCRNAQIKVIFIGDDSQLAPVNELKSTAFDVCSKVYHLTQIVRQGENNPIVDLLTMLRSDIKTRSYSFLSYISSNIGKSDYNSEGQGYSICDKESFKYIIDNSFCDEEYIKNIDMYRIVAYTNNCVSGWNNYIRNTIIKDSDKSVITRHDLIMSYQTIVDDFNNIIINNSEEYIIHDIVNFVDNEYKFKGFLIRFQLIHGGKITTPLFVLDHRDRYTITRYHKVLNELKQSAQCASGGTRVKHWKEYYEFKKKYLLAANIANSLGEFIHLRDLDYGFAITAHKSQGSTYECVFVDINDMVYDKNGRPYNNIDDMLRRLYVACSRAKKNLILCYGN